ncbi:MAG: sigma-54-dependent transcriptional regulator [Myxococcota bacterium]|nr:sigma-54 dependent transcriptional regulator [Myxococcota bacterium]
MKRILLVDDDKDFGRTLERSLPSKGFEPRWVATAADALDAMAETEFAAVLCDVRMPKVDGLALCADIVDRRPDLPVILLTGFGTLDAAVAALRAGAYDFLSKPASLDTIAFALERAVRHHELQAEVQRLRRVASEARIEHSLVAKSAAMRRVLEAVGRVADSPASVLISGESGTGKEVVARAIHDNSGRKDRPFLAVNCAAMPPHLLESELFGHVRGAFTDARDARLGLFREAQGGTVLLDEIGDMAIELQPKLLRVLQERKVRPVGSSQEIPIDVRFVCATNRDLEERIAAKQFRDDLYFRIAVVEIALPPLRLRGAEDILAIAANAVLRFAGAQNKDVKGLSKAAAERLLAYDWPGNVRELVHCMEHAVIMTSYDQIGVDDLPPRLAHPRAGHNVPVSDAELVSLDVMERRYVEKVLAALHGNKAATARVLGIERRTLYRKLEAWGLSTPAEVEPEAR